MPKLNRGRVTGLEDMHGLTAAELEERAARMEAEAERPGSSNDPAWLRRWAQRLRSLAAQKPRLSLAAAALAIPGRKTPLPSFHRILNRERFRSRRSSDPGRMIQGA